MASTINLGNISGNTIVGLGSGLDSDKIITQLTAARQKPIDTLNTKITDNTSKVTQYSDLGKLLTTLQTSVNYLRNPTGSNSTTGNIFNYRVASTTSSTLTASNYLSVTANPGALVGTSNIQIGQLAKAQEQRSASFNSRSVAATTPTTGSYFTAGTFQIGSASVTAQAGATKTGFTLASGDYSVTGAGTGVITTDGIHNITVTGASGGQPSLEGTVSGFTGTLSADNTTATFSVTINGQVYTSNAVDVTQSVNAGANTGIASGTDITFTTGAGGVNETSFHLTTASDITVDATQANITSFGTDINAGLANQSIYQSRKIANFTDSSVKLPLTGLTNNDIQFVSNSYNSAGAFGNISGFSVQKSTGSDGSISITIGDETYRATGLSTDIGGGPLVLQSTTSDKQLRIDLTNVPSVDLSTDDAATTLERSFDYAFGTRSLTTVTVNAGDTLNDVIFNINGQSGTTGAAASILQVSDTDFRFDIKATSEGIDNKYEIFDDSGVLTHTGINNNTATTGTIQQAQDAKVNIDGIEISRSTNTITDAISNVTLNLIATTPDYGNNTNVINVKTDNDLDTITSGIKNFLDAYNAVRVFYSQQTQRDPQTGNYTKDAILGGDTTLQALVNTLGSDVTAIVGGAASPDFNSLSDVGISLDNFAGDSTNVATSNILTFDDTTLTNALKQNFDKLRDIFEFNFTSSSPNVALLTTSNSFTLSNFKLDIDPARAAGQQVKLLNSDGTAYLQNGQPVYLTASGDKITGPAGSPVDGLEFIYTGTGAQTVSINLSQGIADKIYNITNEYTKSGGTLDTSAKNLDDSNTSYTTQIQQLQDKLDEYTTTLKAKFAALESAIASVNNIINLLTANTNAQNQSSN